MLSQNIDYIEKSHGTVELIIQAWVKQLSRKTAKDGSEDFDDVGVGAFYVTQLLSISRIMNYYAPRNFGY